MKVSLIRIFNDERNLSMKLYADRLKFALAKFPDLIMSDFSPTGLFAPSRCLRLVNKAQDYITRFLSHPRQLKTLDSDIYHIVDHANAYLMRQLDCGRVVITCHDLMTLIFLKKEISMGYEKLNDSWCANKIFMHSASFIPKASKLIAGSESTKKDMIRLLGCREGNIRVIYYIIDPKFKFMNSKDNLNMERHKLAGTAKYILLNVGSSSWHKNFCGLIWALQELIKRYGKNIFLVRVGAVAKRHQRLMEQLQLTKYIRIIPHLSLSELNMLYNLSDLLILPSLYEGFGWPAVEAMACGLPVVSSDKGGLREAVEDAAYIIDPYDAKDTARGIIRVLEDQGLRNTLLNKGLERIKKLNPEKISRQIYQIYQEIHN